jgi:hypothetical protein
MIALSFERECNWPEFCEDSRDDRSQPRSNGMRLFESAFPPQSPQSHCHWNVVWLGYFALTSECIDCTPFLMWVWSGHSIPTWNLSYNRILIALIDLKNFMLLLFCICLSFRIKCCHFHPNLVASMSLYILSMDTLKVYKGMISPTLTLNLQLFATVSLIGKFVGKGTLSLLTTITMFPNSCTFPFGTRWNPVCSLNVHPLSLPLLPMFYFMIFSHGCTTTTTMFFLLPTLSFPFFPCLRGGNYPTSSFGFLM